MAKDKRAISGSIRHNGRVYTADDVDELEAALSAKEIKSLTTRGVISGFGAAATPKEDETEEAPSEKAKPKK